MSETTETINTVPEGQEAAGAANAVPEGSQVVPGTGETPSNEPMYTIKYNGQEEKLPMSKLVAYAQQGRDYSEKMGRFNTEVEQRAKELAEGLTETAIEKYQRENAVIPPVTDPANPDENLDEFTLLQKDVQAMKADKEKVEFEKKVEIARVDLNNELSKAIEKYPLANQRNILAILRSNPEANIMELATYEHNLEKERQEKWEKEYMEKAEARGKRGAEGSGGAPPAAGGASKLVLGKNTQEAAMELLAKQN